MLLEITKPVALLLCVSALLSVFYTVFLVPAGALEQQTRDALLLLSLSAGICFTSGMMFRDPGQAGWSSVAQTLPVQLFLWAVGTMLLLFLVAHYLETYCVFYKDGRWY